MRRFKWKRLPTELTAQMHAYVQTSEGLYIQYIILNDI